MFKVHRFKEQEVGQGVKRNVKQPTGLHFGGVNFFLTGEDKTSSGALKSMKKVEEIWRLEREEGDWGKSEGQGSADIVHWDLRL